MSDVRIPIVKGMSRLDIERLAVRFLRAVSPDSVLGHRPTPVLKIFDRVLPKFGFNPNVVVLPAGLEGVTDPARKRVTLDHNIYAALEDDDGRARFTTMHEVGHVLMHAKQMAATAMPFVNAPVLLARRSDIKPFRSPEWQADTFSSASLMPAPALFRLEREHGALTIDLLQDTFLVSRQATEIRISVFHEHRSTLLGVG